MSLDPSQNPSPNTNEPSPTPSPIPTSSPPELDYQTQVAGLPPELAKSPYLTQRAGFEDLAKGYVHAQDMIGRKGYIPPNEDDPHDVKRFMDDIGRPDTPEGYGRAKLHEGGALGWTEDDAISIDEVLHMSGVTQKQHDKIWPGVVAALEQRQQLVNSARVKQAEQDIQNLMSDYGTGYDGKVAAGAMALEYLLPMSQDLPEGQMSEADQLLQLELPDGTKLGNHPPFLKMLIKFGEDVVAEDQSGLKTSQGVTIRGGHMSPQAAEEKIANNMANPEFRKKYFTKDAPGHEQANSEMSALYEMAESGR